MSTAIHRRVLEARAAKYPNVITRLPSGWAVLGEWQGLRGYCLLYPDPVVPHLNALEGAARRQFLDDMTRLGDAVLAVTGALRINYEMLGNAEPALHAHVLPRYAEEPEALRTKPVWFYDWTQGPVFDPAVHAPLMQAIGAALRANA
jgi:diadenosine tetraphosphate (Ap4A) HIT family hydrolase